MSRSEEKMEPTFLDETTLLIIQQEGTLETLTSIEQKNFYEIRSVFNATLGTVEEESGGVKGIIMRNINTQAGAPSNFRL